MPRSFFESRTVPRTREMTLHGRIRSMLILLDSLHGGWIIESPNSE
jgi:hypothetical protein